MRSSRRWPSGPDWSTPGCGCCANEDPILAETLRAYLDGFGDVSAVAKHLHVHPNTVRYRVRRIEKLMSTSLDDPDVRLVLALGLRATER